MVFRQHAINNNNEQQLFRRRKKLQFVVFQQL